MKRAVLGACAGLLLLLTVGCASSEGVSDPRAGTRLERMTLLLPNGWSSGLDALGSRLTHDEPYRARLLDPAQLATVLAAALTPPGFLGRDVTPTVDRWPTGLADICVGLDSNLDLGGDSGRYALGSVVSGFVGARCLDSGEVELRLTFGAGLNLSSLGDDSKVPAQTILQGDLEYEGARPQQGHGVVFYAESGEHTPTHVVVFVVAK
ncbi:MAG: hypothetical protein JKY65_05815 [Planctomycetes bacterium]|nr:hypothetical protein [Planctomycetota bacterium]